MREKKLGDYIVTVDKISKTFPNGVCALRDFSTKIRRSEVLVVIGTSGSGKSTFLRCLNGLEEIDSGSIVIDGIPLDENKKKIDWRFAKKSAWFFSRSIYFPIRPHSET